MSSAEEDGSPGGRAKPSAPKKRRVALACDMCRKRKVSSATRIVVVPSGGDADASGRLRFDVCALGSRGVLDYSFMIVFVQVTASNPSVRAVRHTTGTVRTWMPPRCVDLHMVLGCGADSPVRRNSSAGMLLVMRSGIGADTAYMRSDMWRRSRRRIGSWKP